MIKNTNTKQFLILLSMSLFIFVLSIVFSSTTQAKTVAKKDTKLNKDQQKITGDNTRRGHPQRERNPRSRDGEQGPTQNRRAK